MRGKSGPNLPADVQELILAGSLYCLGQQRHRLPDILARIEVGRSPRLDHALDLARRVLEEGSDHHRPLLLALMDLGRTPVPARVAVNYVDGADGASVQGVAV